MSERRQLRDLASPVQARAVIADLTLDGGTESVDLDAARGRVLAERVTADRDVPGFDRASMDGYAVRAADTQGAGEAEPITLSVCGDLAAGERPEASVSDGDAMAIATGAVLPPGANAVVRIEATDAPDDGTVAIRTAVAPGHNVMPAGADLAAGDWTLAAGTRLTPRTIGLLAALGRETVSVRASPTVAVVSTGDELVQPGDALDDAAGQIYDVNTATLAAAVADAGATPQCYTPPSDDADALRSTLSRAAEACDLVLTSGSTSAGATDQLYRLVSEEGELLLHGIAIKPGKPTVLGRYAGTPYVGLPGYPVSALSIFRLFVAPALRAATGLSAARATRTGQLAVAERFEEGRHRAMPVGLVRDGDGDLLVYPVDRGSGATTSLGYADGVVEMAADTHELPAGAAVTVDLFAEGARPPGLLCVGEPDPVAADLLDGVDRPRYLPDGTVAGARWLRDGVADVAVVTDEPSPGSHTELARWQREWGLVTPAGNPDDVAGLADLVDGPQLVTLRRGFGLRAALDHALADLAVGDNDPGDGIAVVETAGIESPARRVARGDAAVGLGLRSTAETLDLGFVSVDSQTVRLVATDDRRAKVAVRTLEETIARTEGVTVPEARDP